MLTYWTTNTAEVTSYCFTINSSATAELPDHRTGFKDSFYCKKRVSANSRKKNADGKSVTCGKDTELCKASYREQGPRESDCSSVLFTPGRSAHVCLMTIGVKTAAMFF